MTLTTRLTSFFLGVLACVLVGFALALYCLASGYLHRQADERLTSALHTLNAAAEVGRDRVEWEVGNRSLSLGQDASADQVRWLVRDGKGIDVDRSRNLSADELPQFRLFANSATEDGQVRFPGGATWRLVQTRITASREAGRNEPSPTPKSNATAANAETPSAQYPALQMTVGVSLAPVEATLRNLALTLVGLSLALWCLAAVAGRWLCRRALAPVTRMAETARHMNADDWGTRLPSPQTGDELEQLASAFNGLLTRLAESFERQRRFTGDASHQLRTPLAGMLGQVDVALLRQRSPDEYQRVLEAVRSQGNRLRQIVESQLFLARADAEALGPRLEAVALSFWLPEHIEAWHNHPRWPDLRCELPQGDVVLLSTHPPLLAQLLDNLLDNAAKYSAPGTPISVRLTSEAGWVDFAVEDAGCGISPADLPHIFDPFFRSEQARQLGISGAGLGLAVAQRIATALGGNIRAESRKTGGSIFIVRLPRRDVTLTEPDVHKNQRELSESIGS
ncbi:MAG TPA: ATP-binding protein [Pirellulales bacterium]|jgi:heavy metal sensor kinase|nr:ATP-binding protein [Pirellulales bacterium]